MTGFILAAGFGKRMGALTAATPKPLLPVVGYAMIFYSLFQLWRWRCPRAVINLHYCGEQIEQTLRGFPWFPIEFSKEPEILGTAGGLRKALDGPLHGEASVILINPDTILAAAPERSPAERFDGENCDARLWLAKRLRGSVETGLDLGADGRIQFRNDGACYYVGCAAISLEALRDLPPDQYAELGVAWQRSAAAGRLCGELAPGELVDAGTEASYNRIKDRAPYAASRMVEFKEFMAWKRLHI